MGDATNGGLDGDPTTLPLQIISFADTGQNQKEQIVLNIGNLDSILRKCDNLPLCILTVCGPSRMGKSFLLNHIVRYLEALEEDEYDWMEWDNPTKALRGFKFRSGDNPETQGMWMWSRPFRIQTDDGIDVCVLIMDTQGTQDEFTSTRTMASIVGLSLLASSILIFNTFTNLQEDTLTAFNSYVQYGMIAMSEMDDDEREAPFQNLIFLIRDWNNRYEFPYGKGGEKFLKKKLAVKPEQSVEAKQVRQNIRKCFRKLECFLMPYIGENAMSPNFQGSVSELNENFAGQMEEFVRSIINLEDVPIKEMNGNQITPTEFKTYLATFVDTFNSEGVPSPLNMSEAINKAYNKTQVQKAFEMYVNTLNKKLKNRNAEYLSDTAFERMHKTAEKGSIALYKKGRKVGSLDANDKDLISEISKYYESAKERNADKRRKIVRNASKEATFLFSQLLEEKFPNIKIDGNQFYDRSEIESFIAKARTDVLEDFEDKLTDEDQLTLQDIKLLLDAELAKIAEHFHEKNQARQLKAEVQISDLITSYLDRYRNQLKAKYHLWKCHGEDHQVAFNEIISSFTNALPSFKLKSLDEYKADLDKKMQQLFMEIKAENEERRRQQILQGEHEAVKFFRDKLDQTFPLTVANDKTFYDEEDLNLFIQATQQEILREFKKTYPDHQHQNLESMLQNMNDLSHALMERNKIHQSSIEAKLDVYVNTLTENCELKIAQQFKENNMYFSIDSLKKFQATVTNAAHETFNRALPPNKPKALQVHSKKLNANIVQCFVKAQEQNEERRQAVLEDAMSDAKSYFKTELEKDFPISCGSMDYYDEQDMRKTQEEIRQFTLEEFEEKLANESQENANAQLLRLKQQLDVIFDGHLDMNNKNHEKVSLEMDKLVDNIVNEYRAGLNKLCDDAKFVSEEKFLSANNDLERVANEAFKKGRKVPNIQLMRKFKFVLHDKMDALYEQADKKHSEQRLKVISDVVDKAVSSFRNQLSNRFPAKDKLEWYEEDDIHETSDQIRESITRAFQTDPVIEVERDIKCHVQILEKHLTDVVREIVEKNKQNRVEIDREMMKIIDDLTLEYRTKISSHFLQNQNNHSVQTLQRAHEAIEKELCGMLKKSSKTRNQKLLRSYREILEERLSESYIEAKEQNRLSRQSHINNTVSQTVSSYKQELLETFPLDANLFYDEGKIKEMERKMRAKQLYNFQSKLSTERKENISSTTIDANEQFDLFLKEFLESNERNRQSGEKIMSQLIETIIDQYKIKISGYLNSSKFEDALKIQAFHEKAKNDAEKSFQNTKKPGTAQFQKPYFSALSTKLESIFDLEKENLKHYLANSEERTDKLVAEGCARYLSVLRNVISNEEALETDLLKTTHAKQSCDALQRILGSANYPPSSTQYKALATKVKHELDNAFHTVQTELDESIRKSNANREKAKEASLKFYENAIKTAIQNETGRIISKSEAEKAHVRLKKEALERLQKFKTRGSRESPRMVQKSIADLDSEIDNLFQTIINKVTSSAELTVFKLLKECHGEYMKVMKKEAENLLQTDEQLLQKHKDQKEKVRQVFVGRCPILSAESLQANIDTLVRDIDDTFEEYKDFFALKKAEEEAKTKALVLEGNRQYIFEMEKLCTAEVFIRPDHLEGLHLTTRSMVLKRIQRSSPGGITKAQQDKILEEIDFQLEVFKIKNDMRLNYEKNMGVAPAIGIDLGTTYCCVAIYYNGKVIIIPNSEQGGNLTTPSYVAYSTDGKDIIVGDPAKDNAFRAPENTIYDAKRIIGRKIDDPELQKDMKLWPFTVQEDNGVPKVLVNGQLLYPEQVSSQLLRYFKTMAESFLMLEPGTIKKAVITVPAYFNDGQRQATIDAGRVAGLEVLTILNEPTAAAIAYSLERLQRTAKKIVVFDLGGGTFDVAVLDMSPKEINVLGVDGDTHLGGEDFDKNMMNHCASKFKQKQGFDLFDGKDSTEKAKRDETRRRLRRVQTYCEKAKKQLSTAKSTTVSIDAIANGLDLEIDISRDEFDELNKNEFKKTIDIVQRALNAAKLKKEEIDDIVLVGGSSRIKKIQELLTDFFGGKALNHTIHPDHCVAYGAAVKAAMMNGEQSKGSIDLSVIQDVTPMSIGIELAFGKYDILIPKNHKLPCSVASDGYGTSTDNQTRVRIQIYQGENPVAKKNELLGQFVLENIPAGIKGKERLEVRMQIDAMGILHVTAECISTGGSQSITITENKQRMSKETINRLISEGSKQK